MASKAKDHRDVVWFRQLCHAQVRQMAQLLATTRRCYMQEAKSCSAGCNAARALITSRPRRNGNWLEWSKLISITILAGLCMALFAAEPQGVVLVGAGSSVPLPLYHKWADLYNQNSKTIQLQYLP